MEIVDLTEEREALYFVCLEDWSDEMPDAGDHKRRWYGRMKGRGLGVKLAHDPVLSLRIFPGGFR